LPFSTALSYDDMVFISGTIGRDSVTGEIALGNGATQTRQTIENLKKTMIAGRDEGMFGHLGAEIVKVQQTKCSCQEYVPVTWQFSLIVERTRI
jgi:enamine deaminase RidA (YjgF/YER057c/UK114 family)